MVWVIAAIYFVFNFLTGFILGKRDYESLPLYDVGFRFHFATFLIFNVVSLSWFYLGLNAHVEKIELVYITAIIWSVFLAMHFFFYLYARKHSISGIRKEDIFD